MSSRNQKERGKWVVRGGEEKRGSLGGPGGERVGSEYESEEYHHE